MPNHIIYQAFARLPFNKLSLSSGIQSAVAVILSQIWYRCTITLSKMARNHMDKKDIGSSYYKRCILEELLGLGHYRLVITQHISNVMKIANNHANVIKEI